MRFSKLLAIKMKFAASLMVISAAAALGAPANDNFSDRILITGVPSVVVGTTIDGTLEEDEPQAFHVLSTVWYQWVALAQGNLRVRITDSSNYMVANIYSGNVLTDLQSVGFFTSGYEANIDVQQGVTYQFRIGPDQSTPFPRLDGPFALRLEYNTAPANDDFANRIRLTNAVERISFRNVLATLEPAETAIPSGGGYSVWYQWQPPVSGTVLLVDNSPYTAMAVYAGTENNLGTMITNNDLGGGNCQWELAFTAVPGQVYHLVFDGCGAGVPRDHALTLTLNGASRLTRLSRRLDRVTELTLDGERYRSYALEGSTNLTNWTGIATNIYYYPLTFEDVDGPSYPYRFYRARMVAP
jgi:hypothetical protein